MCLVSTFRGQLLVSGATHVSLQTRSLLGEGSHRTHVHSRTRKASGTGPDRIQDRGSLGPEQRRSHAFRVRQGAPLTACGPGAVPSDPSAGRRGVQARERGVGDSVRGPRSRQGRRAEVFQASSASSSTLPGSRPVPVSSLKVTESLETTNSGSRDPGRRRGGRPSRGFRREPVTCVLRLPGGATPATGARAAPRGHRSVTFRENRRLVLDPAARPVGQHVPSPALGGRIRFDPTALHDDKAAEGRRNNTGQRKTLPSARGFPGRPRTLGGRRARRSAHLLKKVGRVSLRFCQGAFCKTRSRTRFAALGQRPPASLVPTRCHPLMLCGFSRKRGTS